MIDRIEINLIPQRLQKKETNISLSKVYAIPAVFFVVVNLGLFIWTVILDTQINDTETQIANTRRQIEINRQIQDEIRTLTTIERDIRTKVEALRSINVNRAKWVRVLEIYTSTVPASTWITSIEESDGLITVIGMTEASAEVALFMSNLSRQEIIDNVVLVEMRDAGREGRLINFTLRHNFVDPPEPEETNGN